MVIGLACNCHAAPGLFRQFLFENHIPNYMNVPLLQGEKAKEWLRENGATDILNYLERRSSFVIVFGEDGEKRDWSDINNADPEKMLRAEMVLEQFAHKKPL